MIDEDLKQRKIADGTYTEDHVLYLMVRELNKLEKKVENMKMKIARRARKNPKFINK